MNRLLVLISDLLWPLSCLGCGRYGIRLCRQCRATLTDGPMLQRHPSPSIDRTLAAGALRSEVLARAIWHLKYRNARDLAAPLGDFLAAAAGTARILPARESLVIPVPLHANRLRERGYNQAELLARRLSGVAMLPCLADALIRVRRTAPQVKTEDRSARFANMENAFECALPEAVSGRSVLLIDDVSTTGATLEDAARALKAAGVRSVTCLVLARA